MSPIFISYTGADRPWAEWIARELTLAGYHVLFQARDFKPTASFMAEMQRAMTQAACTVAVLSPGYLSSPYCEAEWLAVLTPDPSNRQGRLIAVLVADCQPSGLLAPIAFCKLVGQANEGDARGELLKAVQASAASAQAAGAVPAQGQRRRAAPFPPLRRQHQILRAGRALVVAAATTVALSNWLGDVFRNWMAKAPVPLMGTALVCGVGMALLLDLAMEWRWQRRGSGDRA